MKEWGDPLFCLYYEVNEIGRKQKVEKRKAGKHRCSGVEAGTDRKSVV